VCFSPLQTQTKKREECKSVITKDDPCCHVMKSKEVDVPGTVLISVD